MDELEPIAPEEAPGSGNETELSAWCERVVAAFAGSGHAMASVRIDGRWSVAAVYKGLWRVCSKRKWRRDVQAHRRGDAVVLARRGERM